VADDALKAAIEQRHGVRLPDELVEMWAEPEGLIDDGPFVRLLGKLAPHRRAAWLPVVRAEENRPHASRYGGAPWLAQGEAWPECPLCKRPMQLFIQLAADDVPEAARNLFGDGLVQLFYCAWRDTLCATGSDAWEPFATTVLARRVQPSGEEAVPPLPGFDPNVNAVRIIGWEEQADYPTPWELEPLGIELEDDEDERTGDIWDANDPGDKLGGWPRWVQCEDAPTCPRCARKMRLLFQLGIAGNLRLDYGGGAIGYLTRCEDHADVLAFSWQR
jgi:hypothetical protein